MIHTAEDFHKKPYQAEIKHLTEDISMYFDEDGQGTLVWGLFCTPELRVTWTCGSKIGVLT